MAIDFINIICIVYVYWSNISGIFRGNRWSTLSTFSCSFVFNLYWQIYYSVISYNGWFVLHCHLSKGSVIASFQLVLKNEYTLVELTQIMRHHLDSNNGYIGSFKINVDSIQFSGTLISNVLSTVSIMLSVHIS